MAGVRCDWQAGRQRAGIKSLDQSTFGSFPFHSTLEFMSLLPPPLLLVVRLSFASLSLVVAASMGFD